LHEGSSAEILRARRTANQLPVKEDQEVNEDWQLTLSHEALELVANPLVNLYVRGPHPDRRVQEQGGRLVFHGYEVCDAVQGEYYEVDGCKVSNFLLPLYFANDGHRIGRVVFKGNKDLKPLRSFGLNPGGHIPFYDPDPQVQKYQEYFLTRDPVSNNLQPNYREGNLMAHYRMEFFGGSPTPPKPGPAGRRKHKKSL
jgi:hypothetical protein